MPKYRSSRNLNKVLPFREDLFDAVLEKIRYGHNPYSACFYCGVHPEAFRNWMREDETRKEDVLIAHHINTGDLENITFMSAMDGNVNAQKFLLQSRKMPELNDELGVTRQYKPDDEGGGTTVINMIDGLSHLKDPE